MKILFICDSMGSGGAERVISTLSNEFVKKGHSVGILMMSIEACQSYYELDKNIAFLKLLDGKDFSFFRKARLLKDKIREYNPDIVISFLSYVCIYTWWALRKTKIPYVVSERSDPHQRSKFKQFLLNLSFKKACGCVLQTEDALKFYNKPGKGKSIVIHNPVYLNALKEASSIENKIISVGSFVDAKNYFLLLDAFKKFQSNHGDFILKIYGEGPLKKNLEDYLIENNIKNVMLCHKSKNWHGLEYNARIFALSSYTEGMPNVLEEALCLGIPSVATNCPIGGPKELKTIFGDQLILAKNKDINDFVNALEQALFLKNKKPEIPPCLSGTYISDLWINFLNSRVKKI